MTKVLKNIPGRWVVFFGYLSLLLLMAIAALQIYDANYKITDKYKQLANDANTKLTLLLEDRKDSKAVQTISDQIKIREAAADNYFEKSITYINVLIGIRVMVLVIIGIIIFSMVARLRSKNKILQDTQKKLLQNQAHLLTSQQISKTGSWQLNLTEDPLGANRLIWSDETYRIFGYEPGAVRVNKELFFSHVHGTDRELMMKCFLASIENGTSYEIEHQIVLRNGETKFVYERSDVLFDPRGKPEKIIGTCQDITERKMAEQKLTVVEKEKHRLKDQISKQKIRKQKEITRATIKAQEKERLELGRELHDNVNQILSTSKLFIENSVHNPDRREEMLTRGKNLINSCIEELRKLSRFLAPPSLGDLSLRESIEELAEEYNQIDGKRTIDYTIVDLNEDRLSEDLKISIYRIIQEQLNNIRKHAQASRVYIFLEHRANDISLFVEDDGRGFDVHSKRKGLGITNIINRAETFNGNVELRSSPGNGCSLHISFKLKSASIVSISKTKEKTQKKLYGTGS
ncbi:MAG TPA: PAS domain-containing protein [Chitinophagaceae bacterium]|nr:PAS domain-containing protein [Chitinophagaceae bacterium]